MRIKGSLPDLLSIRWRLILLLVWLWSAINAWAAYTLVPATSRPDRLAWLDTGMLLLHWGLILVALVLPFWYKLPVRPLLPVFYTLLFFRSEYLWLQPASGLIQDMLLALILFSILSQPDFFKSLVIFGFWCFFFKSYQGVLDHFSLNNVFMLGLGFIGSLLPVYLPEEVWNFSKPLWGVIIGIAGMWLFYLVGEDSLYLLYMGSSILAAAAFTSFLIHQSPRLQPIFTQSDFPLLLGLSVLLWVAPTSYVLTERFVPALLEKYPLRIEHVTVALIDLLTFGFVLLVFYIRPPRLITLTYGAGWWLLLCGWVALSILWAASPGKAALTALSTTSLLCIAFTAVYLVRAGWGEVLLWVITANGIFQSVIAITQAVRGESLGLIWLPEVQDISDPDRMQFEAFRAFGLSAHPNTFAALLSIAFFAALLLSIKNTPWRWMAQTALLLITAAILASATRASIAVVFCGAVVFLITQARTLRQIKGRFIGMGLLMGIIAAALLLPGLLLRFRNLLSTRAALVDRLLWGAVTGLTVFQDKPLTGVGAGNFRLYFEEYDPVLSHIIPITHNAHIILLSELGVIGLALALMGWFSLFRYLHPLNAPEILALGLACVGVFLQMMVDFHFWVNPNSRLMWFCLMGLLWGYLEYHTLNTST